MRHYSDWTLVIGAEWIALAVIVIVFLFGAQKLPELARAVGRALGEFQKGKAEIEKEIAEAKTLPVVSSSKPASSIEREKLLKAARELGIEVEGKTDERLRAEIREAVS